MCLTLVLLACSQQTRCFFSRVKMLVTSIVTKWLEEKLTPELVNYCEWFASLVVLNKKPTFILSWDKWVLFHWIPQVHWLFIYQSRLPIRSQGFSPGSGRRRLCKVFPEDECFCLLIVLAWDCVISISSHVKKDSRLQYIISTFSLLQLRFLPMQKTEDQAEVTNSVSLSMEM